MKNKIDAHENILSLIGNTPLIKLNSIVKNFKGSYFSKYEAFNPGHSNKDRIALHIIQNAEKKGLIDKNTTIIETSSGNTGFSLSMVSMVKGYDCIVAVSSKSSPDKINMLKSMGAKVYVCPANVSADDKRSYYQVAKRLNDEIKDSIYINQYFNELNIDAHYRTTGPEIWKQTNGEITHLVASSGTGGTISGVGKYLKEKNPKIKIIGVDAYGSVLKKFHETGEFDENEIYPYRIEGLGKNLIPGSTNFDVIDHFEKVTDEDSAIFSRLIAEKEGIFVGYTSGACMQAIKQLNETKTFTNKSLIVTIFCDHGSKYMSKIYSDNWMKDQGFSCNIEEKQESQVEYIKK
tara:strand:- start:41 stop:1084 length:1044 start_codon:yes stop_codon:yes gene_type:complete